MRIVLIGAGNVATHLGLALKSVGQDVVQVFSRTMASAAALGSMLEAEAVVEYEHLVSDADLYIVCVKDAVLDEVALHAVKGREKALWIHTAGSMPLSVWNGLTDHGCVMYPMQTFSKKRKVDFQQIPLFLEARRTEDLEILTKLAASISRKVYMVDSERRRQLHLAAVWCCNFTNYMYDVSARLLQENDLPFDVMIPLIDETAAKVHELEPSAAQTGPAVRWDENVIGKQMDLLREHEEWQSLYEQISEGIHRDHLALDAQS